MSMITFCFVKLSMNEYIHNLGACSYHFPMKGTPIIMYTLVSILLFIFDCLFFFFFGFISRLFLIAYHKMDTVANGTDQYKTTIEQLRLNIKWYI